MPLIYVNVKVKQQTMRQKLLNLRIKSVKFQAAYDRSNAYPTSNMLDRLMNYQDQLLYNLQYFHGTLDSARLHLRAMAKYLSPSVALYLHLKVYACER